MATKKKNDIPRDNNIIRIPIEEAMPDNYLPYAIEVAKERALPDVRDGLKPVHRRILYGAYLLKAFPDKPYYKSARIVGDILGKFHPHGDSSVYDAMVILAQDFSTREPLIDGHGNWGSIDGDGAAAMRYTEARLSPIAMEMLRDIEKEVVEMVPNYSDSEMEPKVLPARYPNLLVNGTFGIAVGLATNIPPHNLREVIGGTLAYIDNNEITTKELMKFIKGPDLPTGGVIIGKDTLISAYETGEGKVALRAKTSIEKLENGRMGIVITEFPYRRNKAKLLQAISEMTGDKRHAKALESITDIRDESDRTGIRAVIELKKSADEDMADKVLKYLFKKTELQCNVSFNMVALANGKPETLGLKSIIKHYVEHQKDIVTKRTKRELEIAERRFHIVEGFIKAIDVLDEVIATIRSSKSKKDASINLINKFGFTELQAEAILELMLYRLTGLEINVFKKEYKELEKEINRLKKILNEEKELLRVIKEELSEISNKYGNDRRTEIIHDESEAKIDIEELIVVEDVIVTLSKEGFIKRIPLKSYNRSNSNPEDIEYREGDSLAYLLSGNTRESIELFTKSGYMYQIKINDIPEMKWKDKGIKADEILRSLNLDNEKIVGALVINNFTPNYSLQFITTKGSIKKSTVDKFITGYTKLQALKLKEGDGLLRVDLFESERIERYIKIESENGLIFTVSEPKLEDADRNIYPQALCILSSEDFVKKATYVEEYQPIDFTIGLDKKGQVKVIKEGKVPASLMSCVTNSVDDVLIFTSLGKVIKFKSAIVEEIDSIELNKIVSGFEQGEEVVEIISVDDYYGEEYIYFFTKNGLIKKTSLKDFEGDYNNTIGYKLKTSSDRVVSVSKMGDNPNILIITKKAMGILFEGSSVSVMGKVASGVTGISLKEEDEVIMGKCLQTLIVNGEKCGYNYLKKVIIISKKKEKREIVLEDIKLQNRAGRGSNLMIVVFEDFVKEVNFK
ncbi:DNA topoisomerase IV subunit A [Clostridium paridis]|uniref:DNA topoisomerase (ATP-hydrolyzing) n=1 Tax=Clostridium paridis TaxID=2803863 RepID=A0A937FG11_9CLOT|nr:DNA topoisomerase IV subunit A [Clostridium paridis]MBL4932513.1 DNA topoisomerase IV subunit A [Clostridium paridis]